MKKWVSILLTLALVLTLAACGAAPAEPAGPEEAPAEPEVEETVSEPEGWVPTKDVECIVPFAPGGGSDLLTRKIIEYADMGDVTMVPVNVEGGGGLVGAEQAAKADPDGYTILAHNPMNLLGQGLTGNSDVWQELTPLAFVVDDWQIVATNKASGWKNAEEFIAAAKEAPGKIKWGITSTPIIVADSYRAMEGLGIDCTIVPYDGGSETISALMGDHIQIMVATTTEVAPYVESGDFVPLFAIGTVRCPALPDMPLLSELGVDVNTGAPRAYFAPAGCSDEVVAYYDHLLKTVCENPDFVQDLADMGFTCVYTGAEQGAELMQKWYDGLKPVFEEYGLAG